MLNEGPTTPTPEEFAQTAAQSDGYELAAAYDALGQSQTPRIREFAEQMIDEHGRSAEALRQAATAAGLDPPRPHVGGEQMRLLMTLQSLTGEDFDREYARQQVMAHTSALTNLKSYAGKGDDPNLRRAAEAAIPMVERHLQIARDMAQALGAS